METISTISTTSAPIFSSTQAGVFVGYRSKRAYQQFITVAEGRLGLEPVETKQIRGKSVKFWTQAQIDSVIAYRKKFGRISKPAVEPATVAADIDPSFIAADVPSDIGKKRTPTDADDQIAISSDKTSDIIPHVDVGTQALPDIVNVATELDGAQYRTILLHAEKISNGQRDFLPVLVKELADIGIVVDVELIQAVITDKNFQAPIRRRLAQHNIIINDSGARYTLKEIAPDIFDQEFLPTVIESEQELVFGQLPKENFDEEYLRLIARDIEAAQANIDNLPEADRRGLTLATYRHFHCGYLPDWVLTKSRAEYACGLYVDKKGKPKRLPSPSARIIIPTSQTQFNAVATPSARINMQKNYWKQHAGKMDGELFNFADAVQADVIVIVEGEFDAMSIRQSSQGKIAAVAILGATNWRKTLLPHLPDLKGKRLILLLDADAAGNKAAKNFHEELINRGCLAVNKTLFDAMDREDRKYFGHGVDANNILTDKKYGDVYLFSLLKRIIADAQPEFDALQQKQIAALQNPFGEGTEPDIPVPTSKKKSAADADAKQPEQKPFQVNDGDRDLIKLILADYVHAKDLTRDEWRNVGMILRRYGFKLADFDTWSNDGDVRYSADACKAQWNSFKTADELNGEGYTIATLIDIAKRFGYKPKPATLKDQLRDVEGELVDFDKTKAAAIEQLRSLSTFDADTVFADEILTAAAFAYLYDKQTFSTLKRDIKHYGDNHRAQKAGVNDFVAAVKIKTDEITALRNTLVARRNQIQAQIDSQTFAADKAPFFGLCLPEGYSVSSEHGISKIIGEKIIPVSRRPIIVAEKFHDIETDIYKVKLAYLTTKGKWKRLPAVTKDVIANAHKLVELAKHDLPVTSNNANLLVDYFDAFGVANEENLPTTITVPNCGWHKINGKQFFIDPRRQCTGNTDDGPTTISVDSASQFAKSLRRDGTLENWRKAYNLARYSPVARMTVAAAIAPPLLNIIGERNFILYTYSNTRAGKSSILNLAASAVGDIGMIRSFDGTKNGLLGAAADVSDYPFLLDERQTADKRLSEQFNTLFYSWANGTGRTRLNKDSILRDIQTWRTIVLANGETPVMPDNATEGAYTRLLNIKAPRVILEPDVCKQIREIISGNYGHLLPLVIDKIFDLGNERIKALYETFINAFQDHSDVLNDHRRYVAVISLADALIQTVLDGTDIIDAIENAELNATEIFKLIPTLAEISHADRDADFVRDFVAQNQSRFIGGIVPVDRMQQIFGKIRDADGFTYITSASLKKACEEDGRDYRKLVSDLVEAGFFILSDKIKKGHKTPLPTVQKKLERANTSCLRIPNEIFDGGDD